MKIARINRIVAIFLLSVVINCDDVSKSQTDSVKYFRDFDLFVLRGTDTLHGLDKKNSAEVRYDDSTPISIKFFRPDRTVLLLLEDSFKVDDVKTIRVYSTSNFYGGKPGRRRIYAAHYEEYKYLIYVASNDSLICQTIDVPLTRNFGFSFFVRLADGRISETSKGEIDHDGDNGRLSRKDLYIKWLGILREEHRRSSNHPIVVNAVPF